MNVRMSGGKPSYSHVMTVSGSGKIVYTAGQLARDIDGNCVGKGDMRAQMEQTFQNLDRCLKAAGATWADVVKTNTFVTDFDEFQKCADIRMRYLGVATPTSTTVGVTPSRRTRFHDRDRGRRRRQFPNEAETSDDQLQIPQLRPRNFDSSPSGSVRQRRGHWRTDMVKNFFANHPPV
jgi:2-iminobutanoate/2-iminopropanoate deaminase